MIRQPSRSTYSHDNRSTASLLPAYFYPIDAAATLAGTSMLAWWPRRED